MKKFLTVLLALSVVFTYTVGSAFAAVYTPSEEQDKIVDVQDAMEEIVKTAVDEHIYYTSAGKVTSIDATQFPGGAAPTVDTNLNFIAISAGADKLIADMKAKIAKAGNDNSGAEDSVFDAALADAYKGYANSYANVIANLLDENRADTTYVKSVYTKAITDAIADAEAEFAKYDPANYSKEDAKTIRNAKQAALVAIDNAATNTSAGLTAVIKAKADFVSAVKDLDTIVDVNEELAEAKTAAVEAITAAADKFVVDWTAHYNGILANENSTPDKIVEAQLALETINNAVAPLVAIYVAQIEAVEVNDETTLSQAKAAITAIKTKATGSTFKYWGSFTVEADKLSDVDFLVKYANDYAAQLKNMYDVETGLAMYNEATVDKALAELVADIQNLKVTSAAAIRVELGKIPTAKAEAAALKAYKETKIAEIKAIDLEDWDWSEERMDAVEAIQKDYIAKIKVALTEEAIDDLVEEAIEAMAAYLNNDDMEKVVDNIDRAMSALGYDDDLKEYAKGVAAKAPGAYDTKTVAAVEAAAKELLYTAVLDKNDVDILQSEIKTILKDNYNVALAVIDAIKTDEEIEAATNAIIEAIKALPTTATLENKAQYLEVQKSLEDFVETPGTDLGEVTNFGTFRTYMSKVVSLEKAAVEAAVRAIPYTVTVDSRDAIEAARTAMDAYEEAYKAYNSKNTDGFKYVYTAAVNKTTLETKEAALESAQMVDAAKKIAALPAVITLAEKAQVEAARASYDLLSDESKEYAFSEALYKKLLDAEAQLKVADKEYIISQTEGMKIKVSTKLYTAANKIRVNWKVEDGDTSVIDGYQVYKSTKAQKNYKFMGKTKKSYMDNKKNLKKGSRYYYKVRAYVDVDGERYFSDWSNKGNRIYK